MYVVDATVLLHAVNDASRQHEAAAGWIDGALSAAEPVGFAWAAVLAFVRVSTRSGIFPSPLAPGEAVDAVTDWLGAPAATVVHPTPRHLSVLAGLIEAVGTAGNLTTDAHLAALALEHRARIVSFDRDFARFPDVRLELLS